MSRFLRVLSWLSLLLVAFTTARAPATPADTNATASAIFYEPPVFDSGALAATSIAVGDLNKDGKTDLVVANDCAGSTITCGTVSIFLGNGDGSFQAPISYGTGGAFAWSVAIADVNGDGNPDVLVANNCSNSSTCPNGSVGVLLGNGDGTFQPVVAYSSGGLYAYSVAVGDLNGDGKADLVVANETGSNTSDGIVSVLLGNGDGTFRSAVAYDSGGLYAYSVAVADVNGDGRADVIVANNCGKGCSQGSAGVLLGNGDGTFRPVTTYPSGGTSAAALTVADVNHDGRPDLLVANQCAAITNCISTHGTLGVLLGNGDGSFQTAVAYSTGAYGSNSLAVADVNGDGNLDVIVSNQCEADGSNYNLSCANGTIAVLLGKSDGTFQTAFTYSSSGYDAVALAVADVNGDGKPDLLLENFKDTSTSMGDSTTAVLLGNGDGTFQGIRTYSPGGLYAESIATADLNGDGKSDLVIANQCLSSSNCLSGGVSVLLGTGNGSFLSAISYPSAGYNAVAIAIADLNSDGKPDLVVANNCLTSADCSNGSLGVLLGNGNGTFQTAVSHASGGYSTNSVIVADVNGDGKPDLVAVNLCLTNSSCANGIISVLLGNGDGTFQPPVTYTSGGMFALSAVVGDANGDGKPDIIVANEYMSGPSTGPGVIGVLLGNGDGTFTPPVTYSSNAKYTNSIAVGDINSDGKLDVLVGSQCDINSCSNGAVSVLLGNGDGTFQPATEVATPQISGGALVLADLNGDGKIDVASGSGEFLLLGNGNGSFQSPLVLGAGGPGIAMADFNGDGKPDLAVGGVAILLNRTPGKTATSTAIVSSLGTSVYGQSVAFTATVAPQSAGVPTGTVTFTDGSAVLGAVPLKNGMALLSTSVLTTGTHSIVGSYSGDANFIASTSPALSQTVNKATTSTTLVSSLNPSLVTQPVTFTAMATGQFGVVPTGSIAFKQGTTTLAQIPLSAGQASFATTYTNSGTRSITAVYSGDANNLSSTSATLKQAVNKVSTITALTSSLNPSNFGQPVTLTATVTSSNTSLGLPSPGGTVTFKDGSTSLGTGTLSGGVVTFTTAALSAGTHKITATYGGNTDYSSSTSANLSQAVIGLPTTTVVASSLNPSAFGQSVTFTAMVTPSSGTGLPAGYVTFKSGTTALAKLTLSSGTATLSISTLGAGTKSITAVYSGDTTFAASTSPVLSQVVTKAATTTALASSLNPSTSGQSVTFTATVSPSYAGTPTGTVTFKSGSTVLNTLTLSAETASFTTSSLPVGSDSITASYSGSTNFNTSSATLTQVVK